MQQTIISKVRFLGKTIGYVGWSLFWLLIWDVIVTVDFMLFFDRKINLPSLPLTLLGSALVVLTSFRNSSAYNRWWEARTLWGAMVNSSRSFARQVLTLVEDDDGINPVKPILLRRHDTNNFPNDVLNVSAALLAKEYQAGRLDSIRLARLESTMVDLSNCQGGMERIANTPLPYPYVAFPRLFITLFCVIVPIGLVETLGWFTPLASTVVGFMLLAIEKIGTDLQSPFRASEHVIQTNALCNNIERNLDSMLRCAQEESKAS
ncbi:bestrophin family protein [Pseudomonas coronafaciens]|uniref:bestrophin family protein n=1 Tax=Pseudomonas coronafaciens TaxID=53409 RepID=UPI000E3E2575|nr:bestrophin family ion channel [Pseudomonas coronafaciens]